MRDELKAEQLWGMVFPLEARKGKEASQEDPKGENSYEEKQQDANI